MYEFSRYDLPSVGASNFNPVDDRCRDPSAYGQDSAFSRWWLSKRFWNTKRGKLALATISGAVQLSRKPSFVYRSCVSPHSSGRIWNSGRFACCFVHRISACAFSDSHSWHQSDVSALKLSYSVSLLGRFDCPGNLLVEKMKKEKT